MADVTTISTHLAAPAARGLGEPDTVLLVGSARFPVHSAIVSRGSGVLRQLLSEFGDGRSSGGGGGAISPTEICLFPSSDAASSSSFASAASLNEERMVLVSSPTNFAPYLTRLYSPTGTAPLGAGFDAAAARGLLTLADYFDSPQLLPEIDNSVVNCLNASTNGPRLLNTIDFGAIMLAPNDCIWDWLDLAQEFKLRRTMAEVLSIFSLGRWLYKDQDLNRLEAVPMAQLLKLALKKPAPGSSACQITCADQLEHSGQAKLCISCKDALLHYRSSAAYELERGLLAAGWGYSRA